MKDWLFQIPTESLGLWEQDRIVTEQVESDPAAAAITDAEAEDFFVGAWAVRFLAPQCLRVMARAFGVRVSHTGPKAEKHAVIAILRQWPNPRVRSFLLDSILPNLLYASLPAAAEAGDSVTMQDLADAYDRGINIAWLVRYLRNMGHADQVEDYLDLLGPVAEAEYRFWLKVGRLTLRRLTAAPTRAVASAGGQAALKFGRLTRQLRQQESQGRALQGDVQHLQRSRRELARAARQSETAVADLLGPARAEVAAAAEELRRRREAHTRERVEAAARHAARVGALERQLAAARRDFAAALAERAAASGMVPLQGYTVAVAGDEANREGYRLLVESAGGRLVERGADLTVCIRAAAGMAPGPGTFCTPAEGLAEFERLLRREILPAVARHRD